MSSQNWPDLVEHSRSLDCIHCGLCIETCPTYRLTGRESANPRGRIHLMRALGEGKIRPDDDFTDEMDGCLLCLRCESVCPAGVKFGNMLSFTRAGLERIRPQSTRRRILRWLGLRALIPNRRLLALTATALRIAQKSGILRWLAPLVPSSFPPTSEIPQIPAATARRRLPSITPAQSAMHPPERAFILEGCLMPVIFGKVNRSTVKVLSALGVSAIAPSKTGCCGSLHAHNGDLTEARRLAQQTIVAFESESVPIVINSAGCGAHMADYPELFIKDDPWHARAKLFASRVIDFTRFTAQRLERITLRSFTYVPHFQNVESITWDDPCHLCHGQNVLDAPREILDALALAANIKRIELDDSEGCCGSAGIYSLLQPKNSRAILESKIDALVETGANLLVTANPGCQLQWQNGIRRRGLNVRVAHIAELLDAAT